MAILEDIATNLQKGRAKPLLEQISQALDENISAQEILNGALISTMAEIGDRFSTGEIFIPEVMRSAKAFNASLELLAPHLQGDAQSKGVAVIGTVKADNHDIGKNLVSIMLQGIGLQVIDLGTNVDADAFCDAVEENNADILALSALLTTTMPEQGRVIERLKERNLRERVYVMVGGAPVTQSFADSIGADCYTTDAGSAAQKAAEYLATRA